MTANKQHELIYDRCIEALKEGDQYVALLFLPSNLRGPVASILVFQQEIDRIPYLVSEPMPGEIRLQWWREVLLGERESEANSNPLAKSVLNTIKAFDLPKDSFHRFLDAKVFDLYNDPMPDRETLEAYLGETNSFIFHMIALIVGVKNDTNLADACGHAGVAVGIANMVLQMPFHLNKQQTYIPIDLLKASGIDGAAWQSAETPNHISAYLGFVALGQEHLKKAKHEITKLPKDKRSVFLSLSHAGLVFKRASKKTNNLRELIEISPISKQWALWKISLLGY